MAQRVINSAGTQNGEEKLSKLTAKESLDLSRSIQKIVKRSDIKVIYLCF